MKKNVWRLLIVLALVVMVNIIAQAKENKNLSQAKQVFDIDNLRIYEVMLESYVDGDPKRDYNTGYGPSQHKGDLKGIKKALPYIKSLGFNAIWMTPIFNSDGNDKLDATGYFPKNYFEIDPKFGTMQDARDVVNEAHKLGMYVFLDGVFGHHKSGVKPSPTGLLPAGGDFPVSYPGSLPFYKQVATWWIDKLEIDGWRLDVAYEVPVDCWIEIRKAIEAKCSERRKSGKKWGILGYMVGEVWKSEYQIAEEGYGKENNPALNSCFDFPMRFKALQVFACMENGLGGCPASILNEAYETHQEYPSHAHPNFMLGSHDLVRFGDLIQRKYKYGKENDLYWKRHKAAFSFQAAYTGPITMYYGEEIGDEIPGFVNELDLGLYDDHAGRSTGQISGFDPKQKDLANYVRALMKMRENHPALWKGKRTNLRADDTIYVDLKESGNDRIVYILNIGTEPAVVNIAQAQVGRAKLKNAINGKVVLPSDGNYVINIGEMQGLFFVIK